MAVCHLRNSERSVNSGTNESSTSTIVTTNYAVRGRETNTRSFSLCAAQSLRVTRSQMICNNTSQHYVLSINGDVMKYVVFPEKKSLSVPKIE